MTPRQAIDASWTDFLRSGQIGIGMDLGTTDKQTSNPTVIDVAEDYNGLFHERLVLSFKSADEAVTVAMLDVVFDDITRAGKRVKCLVIDATNETFFAQRLAKRFAKHCRVILVKGSEKLEHAGEAMVAKQLLGNLFANAHTDGQVASPAATWIKDDRRLVKKVKGLFNAETDSLGQHGDTWDAGKLAYWGLKKRGRPEAAGISISGGTDKPDRAVKNPFARFFGRLKARCHA